jgi:hypothetical protein
MVVTAFVMMVLDGSGESCTTAFLIVLWFSDLVVSRCRWIESWVSAAMEGVGSDGRGDSVGRVENVMSGT